MASRKKVTRPDVLTAAFTHGWSHDALIVDDANLIRDLLTSDAGIIRTIWIRTPWSSEGRWAGAVYSDRKTKADRNIWTLDGRNSLLELVASVSTPEPTD